MSGKRPPPEDREIFEREMAGVKRLPGPTRAAPAPKRPRPAARPAAAKEAPAIVFLPEDEEAGERWARDLGRGPLEDLRRGRFGMDESVDLHGHTEAEARRMLEGAVNAAAASGIRCLRVVHGRGLHSAGAPVLRAAVRRWLVGPALGRLVAAYRQAPPAQGGSGATLVVLRRPRGNAPS